MANERRNTLDLYPLANGATVILADTALGGDLFATQTGTTTLSTYDTSVKIDPRSRGSLKIAAAEVAVRAFVYGNFVASGSGHASGAANWDWRVLENPAIINNTGIFFNGAGSGMLRIGRTTAGALRLSSAADTALTIPAFTPTPGSDYRVRARVVHGTTGTGATGDGYVFVEVRSLSLNTVVFTFESSTVNTGTSPFRNFQLGKLTATSIAHTQWFANFQGATDVAALIEPYVRPALDNYDILLAIGASNMVGRATDEGNLVDPYSDRVYVYSQRGADQDALAPAAEYLRHPDPTGGLSPINTFVADYVANRLAAGRKLLIVPVAYGGTGFTTPDSNGNSMTWRADAPADANGRLWFAIAKAQAAIAAAGANSSVKAILYNAGTTDGINNTPKETYRTYLLAMIDQIRTSLGATIPFLFMQSRPDLMAAETRHRILDEVLQETASFNGAGTSAQRRPYTAYTLSPTATDTRMPDAVHFNAKGVRIIGHSMFTMLPVAEANTGANTQPFSAVYVGTALAVAMYVGSQKVWP